MFSQTTSTGAATTAAGHTDKPIVRSSHFQNRGKLFYGITEHHSSFHNFWLPLVAQKETSTLPSHYGRRRVDIAKRSTRMSWLPLYDAQRHRVAAELGSRDRLGVALGRLLRLTGRDGELEGQR